MLGFSAHTLTKVGKGTEDPSPWLNKLERYNTNALNTTKLTQAHTYTIIIQITLPFLSLSPSQLFYSSIYIFYSDTQSR
jgi:hypothetical protein